MKNAKKLLFALLLTVILVLSFSACEGTPADTTGGDEPNITPSAPTVELSEYSIVYSNKLSNRAADAVTTLAGGLSDVAAVEYIPLIDAITKESPKEILIGNTNRPESAEVLTLLSSETSFVIKTIGDKIVINAQKDAVLISAMNYFSSLVKNNELTENIEYVSAPLPELVIAKDGQSSCKIVHLAGLDTSLIGGNEKYDLDVKLGYDLSKALKTKLSVELSVVDDAADHELEILIGWTSRPESDEFIRSLALNEYGYEIKGNKIVIAGTNSTTTKLAIEKFTETVNSFAADGDLTLYDGMKVTVRYSSSWNLDFPEYEGGTFGGTLDSGNKSFTIVYKDTTAEEFEAYCKKLESEGYTLWQRHDIEDNLHATYTHETRGMIHTYFTANESNVRIITYKKGSYTLPTHTERETVEVVTKSAITQYGLDRTGGSVGMCYVVTLEDGSFIVVDSGTQNKDDDMHHEFYQLLKDLNKRPDGKIVIRAWYLTHEHTDHYVMFSHFIKEYGKTVVIEEFWANFATSAYTYNSDNGGITWFKNLSKYQGYANNKFKLINLHTGMEFYAANMKFEVLYTEEDLFPQVCRSFNNTILVMKMTDVRTGQVMLWMGDLLEVGCKTLAANYDGYLKCDIIQVAHHGKSVALPVYQEALPTVAFWSNVSTGTGSEYSSTNSFLVKNVPVNIISDATYTINLPYAVGDTIYPWTKK